MNREDRACRAEAGGRRRGFTLLELLISIVLMMILLSSVTLIFMRTTDTVNMTEARMTVYMNARYAFDTMENDLLGCLPFNGQQRFILDNGNVGSAGQNPQHNSGGSHVGNAADRMVFRAVTTVADTLQTVEVEWSLIPGSKTLATYATDPLPGSNLAAGDPGKAQTSGASGATRPVFTLVRRVRAVDAQGAYISPPSDGASPPNPVWDQEMCRFVISFNVEYLGKDSAGAMKFSQLHPSPCPSQPQWGMPDGTDPLGNGQGPNDTGPTPYRIPYIRVTLVIVEDVFERQERAVQKVFTIPMG